MRMCFSIKFDRPVDPNRHYVSPGGYDMKFSNGQTVQFDFTTMTGSITEDPTVVAFAVKGLDTDAFPDAEFLKTFSGAVEDIVEFYVYTGEVGEPELYPVALLELELINNQGENIAVDDALLRKVTEQWYADARCAFDLAALYDSDKLFYCCNSCGEINMPGDENPLTYHDSEDLPLKERELYENYWSDRYGFRVYVARLADTPCLCLAFLVCEEYVADTIGRPATGEDMEKVYTVLKKYADKLAKTELMSNCIVTVGQNTDPDGHELEIFVPYGDRTKMPFICECLDDSLYADLTEAIKEAVTA